MPFTIPNEADAAFADMAEVDSVDLAILVAGLQGVGVISGCAVTAQGSPDMTVAVAAGVVSIGGALVTVAGGNVTVAADGSNPRFTLIVVDNTATKSAVAGTASSNPVFPAIPANSVVLAAVYIPAADTAIASNQILDKRVLVAAGQANTYSVDQVIAVDKNLQWADAGSIVAQTNGTWHLARNAEYTGTQWIRTIADNDASRIAFIANGDVIFYTNSDADTTIGSTIIWVERWRIKRDGVVPLGVTTKTGAYTATTADSVILCNGTFTVTLPTASGNTGKVFYIKNIGTGIVTIDGDGSETIDGATTHVITTQHDSRTLVSDGSNWRII